ncbi:MAG TPA: TonB-dependent receptor, partial [Chitinophagaceae bacterium]|nr:TonB-dependent receptor [Chitinophagaceae bacterium]
LLNRTGLHFGYKTFTAGVQYSYTGKVYNDAFNTISSVNGVTGIVPAYHVWDINFEYTFSSKYCVSGGINNATNEKYFNRRITFYPGPGILPADGRTFYISLGIKI